MNKSFIGKCKKTGKWIVSDNILYDNVNKDYYLPYNMFEKEKVRMVTKRSDLDKYKVIKESIGESVCKDIDGATIFTNDIVSICYYEKNNPSIKLQITAKVDYDKQANIFYMKADKKIFLFAGDSYHYISSIKRIGR